MKPFCHNSKKEMKSTETYFFILSTQCYPSCLDCQYHIFHESAIFNIDVLKYFSTSVILYRRRIYYLYPILQGVTRDKFNDNITLQSIVLKFFIMVLIFRKRNKIDLIVRINYIISPNLHCLLSSKEHRQNYSNVHLLLKKRVDVNLECEYVHEFISKPSPPDGIVSKELFDIYFSIHQRKCWKFNGNYCAVQQAYLIIDNFVILNNSTVLHSLSRFGSRLIPIKWLMLSSSFFLYCMHSTYDRERELDSWTSYRIPNYQILEDDLCVVAGRGVSDIKLNTFSALLQRLKTTEILEH
ncbi:hypothetical protein AGLY_006800 [Aphis glycines]|uniref:Uncharacterized protein n=1 Tax=Aphis glycines TaxID=307491 RepID=A0A6G0TQB1_APHGL|nr:hypothetical protein AGLY_006800 [Aphis glycines]